MNWWDQLGKDNRGSRPRCVMLVDGGREKVADRLTTKVIKHPGVDVSPDDWWVPYGKPKLRNGRWDKTPANEAMLHKSNCLVKPEVQDKLKDWWLVVSRRARTPNWDIASTCVVEGNQGILLVEAKAHADELNSRKSRPTSENSHKNHERIGQAINEAACALGRATGTPWNISRDSHYQLSNRFAWSWKLASLGIPVVLVYLGFLNASDMTKDRPRPIFQCEDDWKSALKDYGEGVIDQTCWGKRLDINGTPLIPLIRTYAFDQPLPWMSESHHP